MRRAAGPVVGLDEADLVLVAAEVRGMEPDAVLDRADVGVLRGLASRVRTMPDVADAAAEVLVGIAAGRPFAGDDRAVAWLAAIVLVERNGQVLVGDDDAWAALVRGAADGTIVEREVAVELAAGLRPVRGRIRRALAAAWEPREVEAPSVHACPACGAGVDRSAVWSFPVCAVPNRDELLSACARVHGTHDRRGVPRAVRPQRSPARWYPVVLGLDGGDHGERDAPFMALTDRGPLAFRPVPDGTGFEVVAVDELAPSDLVGSWSALWARGRPIARVDRADCVLDAERTCLDWDRVQRALPAAELVPA